MSRDSSRWRGSPTTEADVLNRLRAGPLRLADVNAELKIAPRTLKIIVGSLRKDGHKIEAAREPEGMRRNVYTLAQHAD